MSTNFPLNSQSATFQNPDFGLTKQNKPNTRIVKFGDGYEHRVSFGLNQNPKTFNLTFKNLSEADADILTNFFDARAVDGDSINYTVPTESSAMKFVVEGGYTKTVNFANLATVKVTFRQVFEP
tara:strand:- start:1302 stop:1673 length:372 start_codon:yes stop_codon:yes gene_type:complete